MRQRDLDHPRDVADELNLKTVLAGGMQNDTVDEAAQQLRRFRARLFALECLVQERHLVAVDVGEIGMPAIL